jgi:hypothetical protein
VSTLRGIKELAVNKRAVRKIIACLGLTLVAQAFGATTRDDVLQWIAAPGPAVMPDAGRVLRANDAAVIASLLPPGYAEEYQFPELDMEMQAPAHVEPHPSYVEATKAFEGQATLDADGAIQNYTAGRPFSAATIKAATPEQAGLMLAWNRIHRWQYYGWRNDELTMNYIKPQVSTLCIGMAASMGAFLLAAGAKGKRFSLPNSKVMIHQPLGGTQGQATEIEIHAREILKTREQLNKILADRTGQPLEKIQSDTERDYYLSAQEAKEYGLVDEVIDKRP